MKKLFLKIVHVTNYLKGKNNGYRYRIRLDGWLCGRRRGCDHAWRFDLDQHDLLADLVIWWSGDLVIGELIW